MSAPLRHLAPTRRFGPPSPAGPFRDDVLRGLRATPKVLLPKYFYDAEGARLFEEICDLPEYYVTRTELGILRAHAAEIAEAVGSGCALVEYGSGAAVKVRVLLDAMDRPACYVPVDISADQLEAVARDRRREYPTLRVLPVGADYTQPFELPGLPAGARRVGFFPGSTIGNLHPHEASSFLAQVRRTLGGGCALLLGVDLRKDPRVLHAAYNDAAGVTAAFNLNLLARINRELGASFELAQFRHAAVFADRTSRIEMYLDSRVAQVVNVGGEAIPFARGERILTECSYKYDDHMLAGVIDPTGFSITRRWTDPRGWFCLALLEAPE